jgi:N-methylhydantoinase B/oxoprolinase/acetone carboxylase alpha subunit
VRFLEAMTASILSNGRVHPAFGLAGGQSGAPGINRVVRADGRVETLAHIGSAEMLPGDVFEIHTPGGRVWRCRREIMIEMGSSQRRMVAIAMKQGVDRGSDDGQLPLARALQHLVQRPPV